MSVEVVYQLEAVQVHHHQRSGGSGAQLPHDFLGVGFVEEAGHGVRLRHNAQIPHPLHLAQNVLHPAQKHRLGEGFADVVHRAAFQSSGLALLPVVAGDEDEGNLFAEPLMEYALQFQSGHAGHNQVRENQVRQFLLAQGDGLRAGSGAEGLIFL